MSRPSSHLSPAISELAEQHRIVAKIDELMALCSSAGLDVFNKGTGRTNVSRR
jgi:hypothetical protein